MVLLIVLLGNWEHWLNRVQEYNYPPDYKPEYSSILVPNVDNVRTSFLMETIAKQSKVRTLVCLPQYTSGRLDHSDFKEISLLFAFFRPDQSTFKFYSLFCWKLNESLNLNYKKSYSILTDDS